VEETNPDVQVAPGPIPVVRLLVLGVVRLRGQAHGYAVHRTLVDWRVDTWTRVKPGSIYHALKQLEKDGRLRTVGVESGSRGPGRTIHELTPDGEAEFRTLLAAALRSVSWEELGVGIAFMGTLTRSDVIGALRDQHRRASAISEGLDELGLRFPDRRPAPHTRDLLELWSDGIRATAAWVEGLVERLEGGEYVLAGEPDERA
jgi:DNA-binding PadR family transcriptional regulator